MASLYSDAQQLLNFRSRDSTLRYKKWISASNPGDAYSLRPIYKEELSLITDSTGYRVIIHNPTTLATRVISIQSLFAGGAGTPGGSNTQLQYNNAGAFGGLSALTWNGTNLGVALGSDATGDIYYRNSSGFFTRLPIGTTAQKLGVVGGLPTWMDTTASGGGGSVAGSADEIQVNVSSAFGAYDRFKFAGGSNISTLKIKAGSSQSTNELTQWIDNSNNVQSSITSAYKLMLSQNAGYKNFLSVGTVNSQPGSLKFEYEDGHYWSANVAASTITFGNDNSQVFSYSNPVRIANGVTNPFKVTGATGLNILELTTTADAIFNEDGYTADVRIEGDTDPHLLFTDGSADAVGVRESAPDSSLTVGYGLHAKRGVRFPNLPTFADTTSYKPVVINSSGTLYKATYWPGGGGATPTWQQVLTAGSTLTGVNSVTLGTSLDFYKSGTGGKYSQIFQDVDRIYLQSTTGTSSLKSFIQAGNDGVNKNGISLFSYDGTNQVGYFSNADSILIGKLLSTSTFSSFDQTKILFKYTKDSLKIRNLPDGGTISDSLLSVTSTGQVKKINVNVIAPLDTTRIVTGPTGYYQSAYSPRLTFMYEKADRFSFASDSTIAAIPTDSTRHWYIPALTLVASGDWLGGVTATQKLVGYTTPNNSKISVYQVSAKVLVTAVGGGGTLTTTCTYTDEGNTSRTVTFYSMGSAVAGMTATGISSYPVLGEIQCYPNTEVSVTTTLTVGTGTYNATSSIVFIRNYDQ